MGITHTNEGIEFDYGASNFKRRTAQRFVNRKSSAAAFAKEVGVTIKTLYNWAHEYDIFVPMNKSEMSMLQKMKLILSYEALSEADRGEFLRKKGLYDHDIEAFKAEINKADDRLEQKKEETLQKFKSELNQAQKDLKKKDKELVEAKAIIELKKKLEDLYGTEDEDPKPPMK